MTPGAAGPVGVAAMAVALGVGWATRPSTVRIPGSGDRGRDRRGGRDRFVWLGRHVTRLVGRPPDPARDRRIGRALAAGLVAVPFGPLATGAVVAVVSLAGVVVARRSRARRAEEIRASLPDVVDLLITAVGAGLSVTAAIDAVAELGEGPVASGFAAAIERARRSDPTAEITTLVDELGEPVRPLVRVLVDGLRHGAPVAVGLERVAAEGRLDRRRRGEIRARRVGVRLVFPLVVCLLPAFALLTVAPALLTSLDALAR